MFGLRLFGIVFGSVAALVAQIVSAEAQVVTAYISRDGNDANTCVNPTVPCRFLPRAYDQLDAGGNIFILDSETFLGSGLVIAKAISVVAVGVQAQIAGGGVANKIVVNAGPNDVVYLDGLRLRGEGGPGEPNGIVFNSGAELHIRNCAISGFDSAGIRLQAPAPSKVVISNCTIYDNTIGIYARRNAGSGQLKIVLDNVTVSRNGIGVRPIGNATHLRMSGTKVVDNDTGLHSVNNGRLISLGNNLIANNDTNGAPTHNEQLQ